MSDAKDVAAVATKKTKTADVNVVNADKIGSFRGLRPIISGDSVLLKSDNTDIPCVVTDTVTGAMNFGLTDSTREKFSRIFAILCNKYKGFSNWWDMKKNACVYDVINDAKASKNVKDTIVIALALEMGAKKAKIELLNKVVVDVTFVPLEAYETYTSKDGYVYSGIDHKCIVSEIEVRVHPELKDAFAASASANDDSESYE